jgi:hypothetical protein
MWRIHTSDGASTRRSRALPTLRGPRNSCSPASDAMDDSTEMTPTSPRHPSGSAPITACMKALWSMAGQSACRTAFALKAVASGSPAARHNCRARPPAANQSRAEGVDSAPEQANGRSCGSSLCTLKHRVERNFHNLTNADAGDLLSREKQGRGRMALIGYARASTEDQSQRIKSRICAPPGALKSAIFLTRNHRRS